MQCIFEFSTYELEIKQIVADVFDNMLGCHAGPASEWRPEDDSIVTAALFFAGSWQGAALLECSLSDSLVFASMLLKMDVSEVTDEDASDALGEILNMLGGNLKSVLPHGVGLSMPLVVRGGDYAYSICGRNRKETFAFQSSAGNFSVTLVQTNRLDAPVR